MITLTLARMWWCRRFILKILGRSRLGGAVAAAVVFVAACPGCDRHAADKEEIRDVHRELDDCNNSRNGDAILEVFTKESFARNEELMKIGMDGTKEQVRALPPNDRMEVLRMRLFMTRSELSKMDGREYVRVATTRGWYLTPEEERVDTELTQFRFNQAGDEASAELKIEGDQTKSRIKFFKQDGKWRYDEPGAMAVYDKWLRRAARDEGVSVDEYIVSELETEYKKSLPDSVWEPMPK